MPRHLHRHDSGRGVANVKAMVGIDNITYAGNHGLEILHPDGTRFTHPMPTNYEDKISRLLQTLQQQVCHHGAWVENKGVLLTYHYRETEEALRPELIARAKQLIETGRRMGQRSSGSLHSAN